MSECLSSLNVRNTTRGICCGLRCQSEPQRIFWQPFLQHLSKIQAQPDQRPAMTHIVTELETVIRDARLQQKVDPNGAQQFVRTLSKTVTKEFAIS